jgi:hypothetical protein
LLLDNFFDEKKENNNKLNIIEIKKENIKLKLLKKKTLLFFPTKQTINYNFFEKTNGFSKNNNNIVYIPNIILNKFLLNITPIGLKKITKEKVLGIEELNKKKKELIFDKEKQQQKRNPERNVGIDGPGSR